LPRERTWDMRSPNTHLYPGARLVHSAPGQPKLKPGDILMITFSDWVRVSAEVIGSEAEIARIGVDGYRTKSGAAIAPKNWFIRRSDPVRGSACYSVIGRAY
jgi:hypothetical protein